MEKICCILLVCMFYIMQSVSACQSQGTSGSAGPEWDRLVSEGSNYIVRATNTVVVDGRKFQHFASLNKQKATEEMQKWFSDFVAYSIPTNDVECYIAWLNSKTNLMRDFIYLCAEDESLGLIRALIGYLSDIKKLKGGGDARSYLEKHKALWCKQNGVSSNKGHREWRAVYVKDKRLRTALGRAETDIESMIEKLHRHLPKDRKEALLKMVIEITGETPEWYRKEMEGKK